MEQYGKLSFVWTLLLILIFTYGAVSNSLVSYDDLRQLGVSCYPKDTCHRTVVVNFGNRSCECDQLCHRYDDCCADGPEYRAGRNFIDPNLQLDCYEYKTDLGVYAVTSCSSNYNGPDEIRTYCETQEDVTNPLARSPVTDISNNITYKNHYCAECNNVPRYNLKSWNIQVECQDKPADAPDDPSYILNRITYSSSEQDEQGEEGSWGFYYPLRGRRVFYPCELHFAGPDTLNIRYCRPHVISSCASNFTRQLVRRRCESYMAVILVGDKFYRNAHCAICNHANPVNRICRVPGVHSRGRKPALSFAVLLDVNTNTGNSVGISDRCPQGQRYDPFGKKCRTVYCIPGFRLVNGVCSSS